LNVAARWTSVGSSEANERRSLRNSWIVGSTGDGLLSIAVVVRDAVRLSVVAPSVSARVPSFVTHSVTGSVRGGGSIAASTGPPAAT